MAKISLRVYNREIEGLIEGGQLDEAIAHCQHILKTFSMHIETYQLLGKAYLEAHRYADAADIFQRILNAAPDDFIAHVGMSIIRDDEGKLDEAIWHMERAYEVQPSNPAIQGELRRLYGRRDGVEPAKIRLTRDALANMYAQGELFNQAIAEIRAVLADDPDRADLQVMLARAYFRVGQKVEAAEISAHLLKKYPYCLDALRVLVEVLPGSARSENTQVYRQRLRLLDPYSSFVTGSVFNTNQVADGSVNLERLEYLAGKQPSSSQPTWAASLGIKLEEEKKDTVQPSWLNENRAEGSSAAQEAPLAPEQTPQSEGLPEFLRAAGWSESDGQQLQATPGIDEKPAGEEISKGDMPDWLKSQIPPDFASTGKITGESVPPAGGDLPDWLSDASADSKDLAKPIDDKKPKQESRAEEEAKDSRLKTPEIKSSDSLGVTPLTPEPGLSFTTDAGKRHDEGDDSMAWLESLAGKPEEKPGEALPVSQKPAEVIPDWLKETAGEVAAGNQPLPTEDFREESGKGDFEPGEVALGLQGELPPLEFIQKPTISEDIKIEETPPQIASVDGDSKPLGIEDDTMAWLEGLAAKQGAKAEELLTKPEDRSEELPDWIKSAAQEQGVSENIQEEKEPLSEIKPERLQEPRRESEQKTSNQETFEQEMPVVSEEQKQEGTIASKELGGFQSEITPDLDQEEKTPISAEEDVTITSWLKNLDETSHPAQVPPVGAEVEPSTFKEEIPEWLKDLEKPSASAIPSPEKEIDEAGTDIPDWLRKPSGLMPDQPIPSQSEEKFEQHEWAAEDTGTVKEPTPTIPDEWVPIEQLTTAPVVETPIIKEVPDQIPEQAPHPLEQPTPPLDQPPPPQVPKGTGALSSIPAQDKDAAILSEAQQLLDAHRPDEAMKEYGKLIKKGRLLDEVIHDLREALYRYPVDIVLWQTLGDAYMRANRLQDALDAYTKAEELLR